MFKRRKDQGFTLIELMIVIAVIGILAVVLVPKMGNIKTSAKLSGVETNIRSVAAAVQGVKLTSANLASPDAATAAVAAQLRTTFSTTNNNLLTNPITKSTLINTDDVNGAIIVKKAPGAGTQLAYIGAVVVKPDVVSGVAKVTIYAFNDKGVLIPDLTQVIQP